MLKDWTLEAGGHRIDREPWKTLGTLTLVIAISAVLTGLLFVSPLLAIAHAVLRCTGRRGFAWRDADGRVHLDISAGSAAAFERLAAIEAGLPPCLGGHETDAPKEGS